jgi:hypothetical protein
VQVVTPAADLPRLGPRDDNSLPATAAAPVPEDALWENLVAPDTGDHRALSDTGPDAPAPGGPAPRRPLRQAPTGLDTERRRHRWVMLSITAGFLVALGVVLTVYLRSLNPDRQVPERKPLLVTRHGGHGTFASVQQALVSAREGDVIELLDEVHEENLVVAAAKTATRVTLQAQPGKSVLWTCRKGGQAKELLLISGADGFHLKGKGITLDGKGQVAKLVVLTAGCPGTTLEGLILKGFTQSAIRIVNCAGSRTHPVRIRDVTAVTGAGEKPAAAIFFDARPDITPPVNEFIEINDGCRFLGMPHQDAIRRAKVDVTGRDVRLPAGYSW